MVIKTGTSFAEKFSFISIAKKFSTLKFICQLPGKIFGRRDVNRALVGEDDEAGFRARRFLDELALNIIDWNLRRAASL